MATAKPLKRTGPGSRQPILKLPSVMPNGKRIRMHPFIYLMKQHIDQHEGAVNKSELARSLQVRPQSLYKWEKACTANRNFPLPVLRARQLADFFNVSPKLFRPDFPWGAQ